MTANDAWNTALSQLPTAAKNGRTARHLIDAGNTTIADLRADLTAAAEGHRANTQQYYTKHQAELKDLRQQHRTEMARQQQRHDVTRDLLRAEQAKVRDLTYLEMESVVDGPKVTYVYRPHRAGLRGPWGDDAAAWPLQTLQDALQHLQVAGAGPQTIVWADSTALRAELPEDGSPHSTWEAPVEPDTKPAGKNWEGMLYRVGLWGSALGILAAAITGVWG